MSPEDPQVVLVGGAPGVGKSTLGRALAARLGVPSLTVDDIMVAVRVLTSPESHPAFHQIRQAGGHLRYFTYGSPDQLIADAEVQEKAVWPVIETLIAHHLAERSPLVLDWWLLPPSLVASLANDEVASVWLHIEPDALWERERRNTDWTTGSTNPEQMLANFMHRSLWRNHFVKTEAEKWNLPSLHLTGTEPVDALVDTVLEMAAIDGRRPE